MTPRSIVGRRAVIGVIGVAFVASALPRGVRAQALTTVRVGSGVDDGVTPLLYALRAGLFKKAGLDVQTDSTASGAALAAGVAGGSIDIAKSATLSLISAYAKGIHFKIVAGSGNYVNNAQSDDLCVLKSSAIKSANDLNGKTIAVSVLKGLDMMAVQAYIDRGGGDSSSVKFIEMPFTAMQAALDQGRADAVTLANPSLAVALEAGRTRVAAPVYDSIAKNFLIAGWFASADFVAKSPSIVERFSKVMAEANAYANGHHAETAPILAEYSKISPDVIAKMTRTVNAETVDARMIQPLIDVAVKYKYIDGAFAAREILA